LLELSLKDVVALHDAIMMWMGDPPCPLLHPDKLESAINRPRWAAHYEDANLARQAVLLAVGISQAQAFEQGNKRAGLQAQATARRSKVSTGVTSLVSLVS
jgi:prophage maintenance system killer protein